MSTPTGSKLSGTGYKVFSVANKSPEQMDLFRRLLGGSQGGIDKSLGQISSLAGGGDEQTWQQLEAPAMRQFGQLQGSLSSRFSGLGGGARRSSGFQNTIGEAGTDLAERLQGQRLGLQQSAQNQLMDLYQNLLGQDLYNTGLVPKKKPFWQELLGSLSGGLGQAAGTIGGLWGGSKLGIF